MRIVITDANIIWRPDNPALEPYADLVLVVCLNGRAVTDKYECFVYPYEPRFYMEQDLFGADDDRYAALESVADALYRKIKSDRDIIFLTDDNPASLYPFKVLSDLNSGLSLHLCSISPTSLFYVKGQSLHKALLQDLSSLNSLYYINSDKILYELGELAPDTLYSVYLEKLEDLYVQSLPYILLGIQEKDWTKAFFDFFTNSYLPLENGFDMIEAALGSQKIDPSKIQAYRTLCMTGVSIGSFYPNDNPSTLQSVEALVPRIDGKEICNYLRGLRLQLAAANNIPFESEECPSLGPCAGTCAKCDKEASYLADELNKLPPEDRNYPNNLLDKWEIQS